MAEVDVTIPTMLAGIIKGQRRFTVSGDDLSGVVRGLFDRHPELRVHLLDEQGALRPHVMFFHNEQAVRSLQGRVRDGDTLTVLQADSGG